MNVFSKKLKKAIKSAGITQKALAEAVGVSPYCITRYVRGTVEPKPETKQAIIKTLDLPEDYFGEIPAEPKEEKPTGEIHRITLEDLSHRIGVSKELAADMAKDKALPGLYAYKGVYIVNESIFCKI